MIQKLKENLALFSILPPEQRELLQSAIPRQVLKLSPKGFWEHGTMRCTLSEKGIYRLRPDYEPEQAVVKCEIKLCKDRNALYYMPDANEKNYRPSIFGAVDDPGFIGIEAGKWLFGLFQSKTDPGYVAMCIASEDLDDYEVLTPTHVLFRGDNG